MATITSEEREKFLQLMQEYNKSLENQSEVEVITAEQMDDTITMPGVKGSTDPNTGEFTPEKYVQAPMSAFAKPATDAAALVQQRIDAFNSAVSRAEDVLLEMQSATEDARGIVSIAQQAAADVRDTLDALRSVEVNARQLAQDVATADSLIQRLTQAIVDAQSATSSATTQAQYALTQGNYAKQQGDRVDAAILDISTEKQAAINAAANANSAYNTIKGWYDSVAPAWTDWFNARKAEWKSWFTDGVTVTWANWFSDTLATGVRKVWADWFAGIQSTYNSWFSSAQTAENSRATAETSRQTAESGRVTAESNRVTAENSRVTAESGRVTAEQNRVNEQNELNSHPVTMGQNGNWWRWDLTTHAYVDTGVLAKGGILYPTFEIDTDDGGLYMYGTNEVTDESFDYDETDGGLYYLPRVGSQSSAQAAS